jgi:hypothetical protein
MKDKSTLMSCLVGRQGICPLTCWLVITVATCNSLLDVLFDVEEAEAQACCRQSCYFLVHEPIIIKVTDLQSSRRWTRQVQNWPDTALSTTLLRRKGKHCSFVVSRVKRYYHRLAHELASLVNNTWYCALWMHDVPDAIVHLALSDCDYCSSELTWFLLQKKGFVNKETIMKTMRWFQGKIL